QKSAKIDYSKEMIKLCHNNKTQVVKKALIDYPKYAEMDGIKAKSTHHITLTDYHESYYEKITPKLINDYLNKPKDADNDEDKTWYPYSDKISKNWFGSNNGKFVTTIEEVEFKAGEKIKYPNKDERVQIKRKTY
ncbi:26419_t:CDS:2, partial [Dentiscutata erythropus]